LLWVMTSVAPLRPPVVAMGPAISPIGAVPPIVDPANPVPTTARYLYCGFSTLWPAGSRKFSAADLTFGSELNHAGRLSSGLWFNPKRASLTILDDTVEVKLAVNTSGWRTMEPQAPPGQFAWLKPLSSC